ncbi:MAG: hypothetical protein L0Z62_14555 [Gemmataceae bacterium]|nr:hypothetical protein [Gemmataceae bacterium]
MSGKVGHPEMRPGEYPQDRGTDLQRGLNYGVLGPHPERNNPRTAYDIKELHRRLHAFPDDVLKRIPVLPEGSRLEHGGTYLDLKNPSPHEFTATGDMLAGRDHWYVPKDLMDYQLWNRLLGVTTPERTGEGNLP